MYQSNLYVIGLHYGRISDFKIHVWVADLYFTLFFKMLNEFGFGIKTISNNFWNDLKHISAILCCVFMQSSILSIGD